MARALLQLQRTSTQRMRESLRDSSVSVAFEGTRRLPGYAMSEGRTTPGQALLMLRRRGIPLSPITARTPCHRLKEFRRSCSHKFAVGLAEGLDINFSYACDLCCLCLSDDSVHAEMAITPLVVRRLPACTFVLWSIKGASQA